MKKLIAISVMIALVTGAVFADISVGGGVEVRFKLVDAEFGDHTDADGFDPYDGSFPKPKAGGEFGSAQIQISGANSDGTLSGLFRLRNVDMVRSDMWFHRVFLNWKPVDIVNIFAGIDQDGKFATDALEGWAFHQGLDDYIHFQWWDYWRAVFPGNWDGFGAAISLFPVSGVDINLVVPFGNTGWPQATNDSVKKTSVVGDLYTAGYRLQANIGIPGIGRVMFSYKGPYNNIHFGTHGQNYSDKYNNVTFTGEEGDTTAVGSFGLSFLLNGLVDGMQAHVGFATDNVVTSDMAEGEALPLYFGAAVHFQAGDFGVKFRAGGTINSGYEEGRFYLTGNIMPWYSLGFMSAYLDFGISLDQKKDDDMNMGFWVNPYVKLPISGGYFQTGFSIRQHISGHGNVALAMDDDYIRFDFPVVLGMSF